MTPAAGGPTGQLDSLGHGVERGKMDGAMATRWRRPLPDDADPDTRLQGV